IDMTIAPRYVGGNMTAPKEVVIEEEEYKLFGGFSEEDINLMAAVLYYEAGHQPMEGKQYVIDVILNRLDDKRFPDSIEEILSSHGQFSSYKAGLSLSQSDETIPIDCYGAVISEIHDRKNTEVLYFSSEGYNGKTPLFKCGDHYFSK
nr:cell wall hydrolase [Lachnospiraceae bacterium]